MRSQSMMALSPRTRVPREIAEPRKPHHAVSGSAGSLTRPAIRTFGDLLGAREEAGGEASKWTASWRRWGHVCSLTLKYESRKTRSLGISVRIGGGGGSKWGFLRSASRWVAKPRCDSPGRRIWKRRSFIYSQERAHPKSEAGATQRGEIAGVSSNKASAHACHEEHTHARDHSLGGLLDRD